MKLNILTAEKKVKGQKDLPSQFNEEYRPDLITRAVNSLLSMSRQPYGASPDAGFRQSSKVSKRRRTNRGRYGMGISRVNRKILSRRGMRMFWVGAFSPQTVGGHRAHPPKSWKDFTQGLNQKERRKAIRSAMAATLQKIIVEQRGHFLPQDYPFIIDASVEQLSRTKDVEEMLLKLGFQDELARSSVRKVRAGRGKSRGRKYRHKKGLLLVVSQDCPLMKSAKNISGIDIVPAKSLNVQLLAPGALPGRVTLWTDKAMDIVDKEKLFI